MRKNKYIAFLIAVAILGAAGCHESLPLREDLSNMISVSVRSQYETVSHSPATGSIRLYITLVNRTDETLDDIGKLTGRFDIEWLVPPANSPLYDIHRTMVFTSRDLFYAAQFNPQSKRLTVAANDSVVVSVIWDLSTDDSTKLLRYFPWVRESVCHVRQSGYPEPVYRRFTLPQWFRVRASIQLFDKTAIMHAAPVTIKHCIMIGHNGEVKDPNPPYKPCTDLTQFDPCSVIGQ